MIFNTDDLMDLMPKHSREAKWSALPLALGAAWLVLAAGCAVGPDYKRPEVSVPAAFCESVFPFES